MRAVCIQNLIGSYGTIDNTAIWNTIDKYALDGVLIPINQAKMSDIDAISRRGKTPMVWIDPLNWYGLVGAPAADKTNQMLLDIGFVGANATKFCPVVFDIEEHSIEHVIALLKRWRYWRWRRETFWTMEPLQASWVGDPQVVSLVTQDMNLVVVPQTYRNLMQPVAQDAVRDALLQKGYPDSRIKLFYGCFWRDEQIVDHLIPPPEAMDGMIWKMEKLQSLTS